MRALARAYDGLIFGLAWIAGLCLALTFVAIVWDVCVRTVGLQPPDFTSALTEYAMLVVTMAVAPWLVRLKGHVWVEAIDLVASQSVRRWLAKLVSLACIGLCLILAWYAGELAIEAWGRGELDIRSIILPRWFLYAVLAVGLFLCATEFLRCLLGFDDLYGGRDERTGA